MTEMFGEAWSPMSVPDLAPDDDEYIVKRDKCSNVYCTNFIFFSPDMNSVRSRISPHDHDFFFL